jgi:hypothetical protein
MKNRVKTLLVLIACLGFAFMAVNIGVAEKGGGEGGAAAAPGRVQAFPTPVLSSTIPTQVMIPGGVSGPVAARPFFDYFSWQSFVALNWQVAMSGGQPQRGQPASSSTINSQGMRVWQSYKADWETFRPGGAAPTAWNTYALNPTGSKDPCGNTPSGTRDVMPMISKMDSVIDGFNQAFSGPLIDQNGNYVRYEIRLNEVDYNQILTTKWYIFKNVSRNPANPNVFPINSIEIKAAWKVLTPAEVQGGRFFTITGLLINPNTQQCTQSTMGLVGFHIANKVDGFREWIWSTFEHVDNAPGPNAVQSPTPAAGWSFNNGTATPATPDGYSEPEPTPIPDNVSLPTASPTPVQVRRVTPITYSGQSGPTTDQINAQWQAALSGTIWQNYELVATQWPSTEGNFQVKKPANGCPNPKNPMCNATGVYPVNADTPFPANDVANITMETYLQDNSCMKCHYGASQDDFTFLLAQKAFKPPAQQGLFMTMTPSNKRGGKPLSTTLPDPVLENLRTMIQRPKGRPQTTRPRR